MLVGVEEDSEDLVGVVIVLVVAVLVSDKVKLVGAGVVLLVVELV